MASVSNVTTRMQLLQADMQQPRTSIIEQAETAHRVHLLKQANTDAFRGLLALRVLELRVETQAQTIAEQERNIQDVRGACLYYFALWIGLLIAHFWLAPSVIIMTTAMVLRLSSIWSSEEARS